MTKNIKIAIVYRVCQRWRAPVFRRLNSLADFEVTVFHSKGIPGTKLVNTDNYDGFRHKELYTFQGSLKSSNRTAPVLICPSLFFHLLKYSPEIIICEGGSNIFNNIFIFIYSKIFRKPVIWWTLGELHDRKFSGLGKVYRALVNYMENSSTALLGYSTVALNYFRKNGFQDSKCFVAVNCVDTDKVFDGMHDFNTGADIIRNEMNLQDSKVVLFVGALLEEKNIDRLINSFGEVLKRQPTCKLVIVGDGPYKSELERLVDKKEISNQVIFTGQVVENVGAYFQLADIFVLPGLGGLAISEALAHGLPVICGRGDGCEEDLVINGKTGYRILSSSNEDIINEITDKILMILEDKSLYEKMSQNAELLIRDKYNINSYIKNVEKAIRYSLGN